ncbi:hypothetical protein [Pontibacter sp. G13]|uniref:hypothetical protein n=1 Tax=Pontibacter sp. G13 TaxID=3074898 RepID=UPI00288A0102|nr:hypothetical protein [Pontibacter sp. G13]WNJ17654.1 hypothetical protein RJD25_22615 [Pontibacter sp. G13]
MKSLIRIVSLLSLILLFATCDHSQTLRSSTSQGSVSNGSLHRAARFPKHQGNVKYFSWTSYYLLGRSHMNDRVYRTLLASYAAMAVKYPGYTYRLMECSRKHGGKMWPHRTHQNGLSIDFMTPLKRKGTPTHRRSRTGILHYAMQFHKDGTLKGNKHISIDYAHMGEHLLSLDDAARAQGLKITKVIFKIELQPGLFRTSAGKELKRRGIYFVRALPKLIDNIHDDHYHVDFAIR